MTLDPETRLGPYEIVELRGKGGMGEVYRARDTRLGREVAVKVLSAELAASPGFRRRFEREAKTISQLQHPHVCTLYDVGSEAGVDFLVMELLEGETLEERLARGRLELPEVVRIGCQVAEAIHAAHRRGLVHRDLKPANVMLTASGVKVLDFGLAKSGAGASTESETELATLTRETAEGTIVGSLPTCPPSRSRVTTSTDAPTSGAWAVSSTRWPAGSDPSPGLHRRA